VRAAAALACALAALALLPATAGAAKRTVPRGFYSAIYAGDVENAPPATQTEVWDRLAEAGVEAVRIHVNWQIAQSQPNVPYHWARTDAFVAAAATRGMSVMATVITAPEWAKLYPGVVQSPPRNPSEYAAFLRTVIGRYGPNGTFWDERPELPKRPVRHWQIWNEPELSDHWWRTTDSWGSTEAKRYGALLRASYRAIRKADPGAKVVLGGLTNRAWETLASLYRKGGIRGYFDVAAVHMFPGRWQNVSVIVKRFRRVLDDRRARRLPIWVTEMTWPAASGRASVPPWADSDYYRNFVTTESGTATRLKGAYGLLAGRSFRKRNRIERVHWFNGASTFRGDYIWNYSGLLELSNMRQTPAYAAFRASARKHQGCSKDAAGRCR
jgi:hypothetical protein